MISSLIPRANNQITIGQGRPIDWLIQFSYTSYIRSRHDTQTNWPHRVPLFTDCVAAGSVGSWICHSVASQVAKCRQRPPKVNFWIIADHMFRRSCCHSQTCCWCFRVSILSTTAVLKLKSHDGQDWSFGRSVDAVFVVFGLKDRPHAVQLQTVVDLEVNPIRHPEANCWPPSHSFVAAVCCGWLNKVGGLAGRAIG